MGAKEAVDLLIEDSGDKNGETGYRNDFAMDRPYRSLLQRCGEDGKGMAIDELLGLFDWKDDDAAWIAEYDKKRNSVEELIRLRRRVCFAIGGWREINEDFGRGSVSCLRDLRTPFVTSRTPLRSMRDEFAEEG